MTAYLASRYSAARRLAPGDDTDWRARAACLGEDPELFFPVGNSRDAQQQAEQAKQICRRCPVTVECGRLRDDLGAVDGVWGGRSEQESPTAKRRVERMHAREILAAGRALAVARGRDILIGLRQGQTEYDIARWTKAPRVVVRQAVRLLKPSGQLRNHGDTMERILLHAGLLRDLIAEGRSDWEIAAVLRTATDQVPDARAILAHMDAAAAWVPEEAAA